MQSQWVLSTFTRAWKKHFSQFPFFVSILPPILPANLIVSWAKSLAWSGFSGICLQDKRGQKYFVFRGTDPISFNKKVWKLFDIWDIMSDIDIISNSIPQWQLRSMIDFIESHITKEEKVIFIWHSLWGLLTQIAAPMYMNQLKRADAFNAPWWKHLQYQDLWLDDKYQRKIQTYYQERENNALKEKVFLYRSQDFVVKFDTRQERQWIGQVVAVDNDEHGIRNANSDLAESIVSFHEKYGNDSRTYRRIILLKKLMEYNPEK